MVRSRREQVQAYRFLVRRIVSGLLSGEPETTELPMRRFGLAVVGSVLAAALVFAGLGIWGLLHPAGVKPVENVIIVERETGAKYLYLQGQLHPILNWTSALLILKQPQPPVRTMSQVSLRDVPRGEPVGIVGAPDSLPAVSALLGLPWAVCGAARSAGSVLWSTDVFVGSTPAGGRLLGSNEALLVGAADPGGERFVLLAGHRLRVRDAGVLAALGWVGVTPVPVGQAWLNALPPGPDLKPPVISGAGEPAAATVDGTAARVGQLFGLAGQRYVMLRQGLAPVGQVTGMLLQAAGQQVSQVSAGEVGRLLLDTTIEPPGFPARLPTLRAGPVGMVCATYPGVNDGDADGRNTGAGNGTGNAATGNAATGNAADGDTDRPIDVESFAGPTDAMRTAPVTGAAPLGQDGVPVADQVLLPGGHAALVRTAHPAGGDVGSVYVITDQGLKYPLAQQNTAEVEAALGYQAATPTPVPASILALIPTGVALDPAAAVLLHPAGTEASIPTATPAANSPAAPSSR
jgi:type VII secretion protein EccB